MSENKMRGPDNKDAVFSIFDLSDFMRDVFFPGSVSPRTMGNLVVGRKSQYQCRDNNEWRHVRDDVYPWDWNPSRDWDNWNPGQRWKRDELQRFPNPAIAALGGVDIREENGSVVVDMDVPGINPDEINLEVHPEALVVKWEKSSNKKDMSQEEAKNSAGEKEQSKNVAPVENNQCKWVRKERMFCSFEKTIRLPGRVDTEKSAAVCRNGVLTITMPLVEDSQKKKLVIEK